MKAITTLMTISAFGFVTICQAQTVQENSQTDTLKQMNLLDEQTKMFGQIFEMAGAGAENPLGSATNYSEVIEQMDVPEAQKETLREQYKVYDLSLDPTKKDSLRLMVGKLLENAIEKTQSDPND